MKDQSQRFPKPKKLNARATAVVGGVEYTLNKQGCRAVRDFQDDPDTFKVLIVGDSFTFGGKVQFATFRGRRAVNVVPAEPPE